MPAHDPQDIGLLQVAVFLDELVLLAALAVAGARLADGTAASIALAVALPSSLRSPGDSGSRRARRAGSRTPRGWWPSSRWSPLRALLLAWAGLPVWGAVVFVASAALLTLGELSERR